MTIVLQPAVAQPFPKKGVEAIDPVYRQIRDLVYKISGIYKAEEKLYLLADGCGRCRGAPSAKSELEHLIPRGSPFIHPCSVGRGQAHDVLEGTDVIGLPADQVSCSGRDAHGQHRHVRPAYKSEREGTGTLQECSLARTEGNGVAIEPLA